MCVCIHITNTPFHSKVVPTASSRRHATFISLIYGVFFPGATKAQDTHRPLQPGAASSDHLRQNGETQLCHFPVGWDEVNVKLEYRLFSPRVHGYHLEPMSHEFLLNFISLQLLCQYPVIPPFCCGARPGECTTNVCSGSVLNVPGLCYLPLVDHLVRGQCFIFLCVFFWCGFFLLSWTLKGKGRGQ